MSIANTQLSILMLLSMQSDLQAQISQVSQRRQVISSQEAVVVAQTTDASVALSDNAKYKALEIQDNMLDLQQEQYETKLKAVTANLEAQQKLIDNNIKEDFAPKMSV